MFILSTTVSNTLEDLHVSTIESITQVLPIPHENITAPELRSELTCQFGVLVGITGSINGKVLYKSDVDFFSSVGELMFGMELEGDMLKSFAGELGNMISGGLCTNVFSKGMTIDITAPTIMEGNMSLSGFKEAIEIVMTFQGGKKLEIGLMID